MKKPTNLIDVIDAGWHTYQEILIEAVPPLDLDQLELRAAPSLRSIGEIARHIIGARARWFYQLMGEGGDEFKSLARWDRRGSRPRSAADLVQGLEVTWRGMQAATGYWTAEDWQKTWPGDQGGVPEVITRQWVIWHLIEHDLHHSGEISMTLGMHGIPALGL